MCSATGQCSRLLVLLVCVLCCPTSAGDHWCLLWFLRASSDVPAVCSATGRRYWLQMQVVLCCPARAGDHWCILWCLRAHVNAVCSATEQRSWLLVLVVCVLCCPASAGDNLIYALIHASVIP